MSEADELRMYLIVRRDLQMPAGKLAAQAGHAFVGLALGVQRAQPDLIRAYEADHTPKIVVAADDGKALAKAAHATDAAGIPCYVVKDAGRTFFAEPTVTVAAIGPCRRIDLPPYVRRLRLYTEAAE